MLKPAFLLLDEPAAGLATDEIERLGQLIKGISRQGTDVLPVEHHAEHCLSTAWSIAQPSARDGPFPSEFRLCQPVDIDEHILSLKHFFAYARG